jgi:HAMP domain-containing protein
LADHDAYILRGELHKRNPKAIDEHSAKRFRDRRYYDGYFLELLNLNRLPRAHSPASDGTPAWWERKAHNQYGCSVCRKIIANGERYIGCKKLSPGRRGKYGYRGRYLTDYYHIVCLLEVSHANAGRKIENASSEISELRDQIASFMDTKSQRKTQIKYCETAKQKAERDYEDSKSWRRITKWVGCKYTTWSRNREILELENEINRIEDREIPIRQNRISELNGTINSLRSWQTKLKEESAEFSKT